jgi:transcription-repair coupling factor (superfamily II helicase)
VVAAGDAARRHPGLTLVIAENSHRARRWVDELSFYAADLPVLHFPEWETLAYDVFSPHQDIISERLATLHRLPRLGDAPTVLVVTASTLLQRLAPRSYIDAQTIRLEVGQRFDVITERPPAIWQATR